MATHTTSNSKMTIMSEASFSMKGKSASKYHVWKYNYLISVINPCSRKRGSMVTCWWGKISFRWAFIKVHTSEIKISTTYKCFRNSKLKAVELNDQKLNVLKCPLLSQITTTNSFLPFPFDSISYIISNPKVAGDISASTTNTTHWKWQRWKQTWISKYLLT